MGKTLASPKPSNFDFFFNSDFLIKIYYFGKNKKLNKKKLSPRKNFK